ncbi:beta-ketoacyl-ACP synthase [Ancylothrix sp. C2]|uniref:beta-ketoacyl-ACP synthase n=1 Tax=Ancylothrix sp. D3o TaxID=2953691 RepID=UPI0021BAF8C9|nr:beta-ketoacyl-ACP synthase [Ancylothrix sp. D3o]MCT7950385.1 beta-ketoacyl-ACP synthase [Ancylothrix sp. D3o]
MDVVVTGIGLISALGQDLQSSWNALLTGIPGIHLYQPFAELPHLPLGLIEQRPVDLFELIQQVVAQAVADAGLLLPLSNCGVVIGSSRALQAEWERLAGIGAMPLSDSFIRALPHTPAISAARQIGSTGPVLAPMAACATGIWALAQGFGLIQRGECEQVLAGAVEMPVTPLTLAGFAKMGALAETGCYPFDRHREGLVLGEAGVVFILESLTAARRRGAKIYGKILGFGLTNDAFHVISPDMSGKTAAVAVKNSLYRSKLSAKHINYIHVHGTGTTLNDQCEARLIEKIFPFGVPVSSTKGATGHTLGASGMLGAAFCLMALQEGIVPPCAGLKNPEFDLDFVREARKLALENVLCFAFGFGGQNAVISLGK